MEFGIRSGKGKNSCTTLTFMRTTGKQIPAYVTSQLQQNPQQQTIPMLTLPNMHRMFQYVSKSQNNISLKSNVYFHITFVHTQQSYNVIFLWQHVDTKRLRFCDVNIYVRRLEFENILSRIFVFLLWLIWYFWYKRRNVIYLLQ